MTTSWLIKDRRTGQSIMQTFDPAFARSLNREVYDVVPVGRAEP